MSDGTGLGGVAKDVMSQVDDLPKSIVQDAGEQIGLVSDQGQKAMEQGQSGDDSNAGGGAVADGNKNDVVAKARAEELRARLKSMIEGEIQEHKKNREENEQQRYMDWEEQMQKDEQEKVVEQKKAQDRVAEMIYQQRAGSGEAGKRKG